jgi:hypothetical protein
MQGTFIDLIQVLPLKIDFWRCLKNKSKMGSVSNIICKRPYYSIFFSYFKIVCL